MKWYIVNITSGYEQKIKNTIETIEMLQGVVTKVIVPISQKHRFYKDRLYNYAEKLYPGYVFVACEDKDYESVFSVVATIQGVLNMSSIKGIRRVESRIYEDEMLDVLREISSHDNKAEENDLIINIGDRVRVIDGPFASFEGIVQDTHKASNRETKVKIASTIFSGAVQDMVIPISQIELLG